MLPYGKVLIANTIHWVMKILGWKQLSKPQKALLIQVDIVFILQVTLIKITVICLFSKIYLATPKLSSTVPISKEQALTVIPVQQVKIALVVVRILWNLTSLLMDCLLALLPSLMTIVPQQAKPPTEILVMLKQSLLQVLYGLKTLTLLNAK